MKNKKYIILFILFILLSSSYFIINKLNNNNNNSLNNNNNLLITDNVLKNELLTDNVVNKPINNNVVNKPINNNNVVNKPINNNNIVNKPINNNVVIKKHIKYKKFIPKYKSNQEIKIIEGKLKITYKDKTIYKTYYVNGMINFTLDNTRFQLINFYNKKDNTNKFKLSNFLTGKKINLNKIGFKISILKNNINNKDNLKLK